MAQRSFCDNMNPASLGGVVGAFGLGKKDKEHTEFKRKADRAKIALETEAAQRDNELSALRYQIDKAKLLKAARDAGLSLSDGGSTTASTPATPEAADAADATEGMPGRIVLGYVY
jgi:hypothetical protein